MSSSSDIDSHINEKQLKQRKYHPSMWKDVPVIEVNELPEGIDGLVAFELKDVAAEDLHNALKDGRKWNKNCPSKWSGHTRVRYANCKGSYACTFSDCPYMVEYGVTNTTQFENTRTNPCKACGHTGQHIPCGARRYISYGSNSVNVFHCGKHTCQASVKTTGNIGKIKELIKNNPKIKPAEVQSSIVLSAFRDNLDWETVEKEARSVLNKKKIGNMKEKIKKEVQPYGHNFEAVVNFKEYCDKKDKFYVYKVNDKRGNPDQPSFVFKTSTEKLKIAIAMDRRNEGFLSEEFCFFDGKHNRCKGFTTLTASVYHPLLRKQIALAIMEAEGEKTENVELFWKLLNEAISKISNGEKSFNPIGWCTDMSGALISGISKIFGEDSKTRIKSCEFHFKDQRNKKANRLKKSSVEQFKTLCNNLLNATTEAKYNSAKESLDTFINADPDREFLKTWISWWNERRGFIFHAFAPTNAPNMNQAEVIHAGWAHRDQPKLSLVDVCQADARDNLMLELELQGLQAGSTIKGRGPTFIDHRRERYQREINRARQMGKEMFDGRKVDPNSSHRPPSQKKKQSKKDSANKKKIPTKQPVSSNYATQSVTPASAPLPERTTHIGSANHINARPKGSLQTPQLLPFALQQHEIARETNVFGLPMMSFPAPQPNPTQTMDRSSQMLPAFMSQQEPPWHSGMSPNAYEFILMPSKVKKCYGCGSNFVNKYRTAPHNIIIKHIDKRVIGRDERTGHILYSSNYSNTYYHPIASHIHQKNPLFTGLVYISFELYESLDEAQRRILNAFSFNTIIR